MTAYDSGPDTIRHIARVRELLTEVRRNIADRMLDHDFSKLGPEEKPIFDAATPRLKELTYGSDEYKASLAEMKVALDHHYANNSHHPEHFLSGINGMSLLDLIEMLCDWKAAVERHADGDYAKSLDINKDRFGIGDQLFGILVQTSAELGFLPSPPAPVTE